MDKRDAVELLKDVLKINTTNPPGNEEALVERLLPVFEKAGIQVETIDYSVGRKQLIATCQFSESGKILGFSGHMDVVPVGDLPWTHDPFAAEEAAGRIYGRGAGDMKSGLIAIAAAIVQLKEEGAPLNGTIKFIATIGEETSSIGAKQLVEMGIADDLDALIIGEPTGNQLAIAEKGALWLRITTYGKTAHGSTPENGINANEHMVAILARFLREFKLDYEPDELLSEPTSSIDVLHGGNGTNVIPDKCTVEIDIRTLPSQDHKEIIRSMWALIEAVKKDYPNLRADIEVINDLHPVQTPADDPFVQQLKKAIESVTGKAVIPYGSTGYTDGASFARSPKKYPIVIVGPGNPSMSHQPDEYVEIKDFFDSIAVYKKIAADFLK